MRIQTFPLRLKGDAQGAAVDRSVGRGKKIQRGLMGTP
jgi:hypothetical protein